MRIRIIIAFTLGLISLNINSQTQFKIGKKFYSSLSDSQTNKIICSFDKLLLSVDNAELDTALIDVENRDLNREFFRYLKGVEGKDTIQKYFQGQLINLYPIENNQFMLTIAYVRNDEIGRILTFHVKDNNGNIVFANPLKYNTKYWKSRTIGTLTYYYQDTIDTKRAELFNQKNILIAQKLNLPVRDWDVYMCRNYQEVNQIQGCVYDYLYNGKINSGYIMDPKTLFTCMNDEDFSHDVLHIYASQIRGKERNSLGECGLAYYWGNSYHLGDAEKAPDLEELLPVLRLYLREHNETSLLELLEKSPDVLAEYGYSWPVNVNRIIAGVLYREVEKQKGTAGVIELLKCGKGNDNFLSATGKLIGISRDNFEKEVYKLIFE